MCATSAPVLGHCPFLVAVMLGALPEGISVLEASASTGKTFTIANLVARYVAAVTAVEAAPEPFNLLGLAQASGRPTGSEA